MNPSSPRGETFVVWLDPVPGRELAGRVEHVATSERVSFANAEELIAVLARARGDRTDPVPAEGPAKER